MADGKIPVSEKRAKRVAIRHNGDDREVLRMRAFAADLDGRYAYARALQSAQIARSLQQSKQLVTNKFSM
jgi:hypothetical protein